MKKRIVSGDRDANDVGGFPPSCSYTLMFNQQCWHRISSPLHVFLRQARSIVRDRVIILKSDFWWIIFSVVDVAMNFPDGTVKLVTSIQLDPSSLLLNRTGNGKKHLIMLRK